MEAKEMDLLVYDKKTTQFLVTESTICSTLEINSIGAFQMFKQNGIPAEKVSLIQGWACRISSWIMAILGSELVENGDPASSGVSLDK
jgi:hypothetical protein